VEGILGGNMSQVADVSLAISVSFNLVDAALTNCKWGRYAVALYPFLALTTLIEGVVRGILTLIGKAITFFIPKECNTVLEGLDRLVAIGAFGTEFNLRMAATAVWIVMNRVCKINCSCLEMSDMTGVLERAETFARFHINGFSAPFLTNSPNPSPAV
jgi:hypothetical protein